MISIMRLRVPVSFLAVFILPAQLFAAWDPAKVEAREQATTDALADFVSADSSLERFFDEAHGFAVFPSVGEGAFVVGGAHGKGEVFEQGASIGTAKITEVSVGLSLGGKTFREIIFFKSKAVLDKFKSGSFDFGAKASAIAAEKGAGTKAVWSDDVAVFTMGEKGLMADASVTGQHFKFEPHE